MKFSSLSQFTKILTNIIFFVLFIVEGYAGDSALNTTGDPQRGAGTGLRSVSSSISTLPEDNSPPQNGTDPIQQPQETSPQQLSRNYKFINIPENFQVFDEMGQFFTDNAK